MRICYVLAYRDPQYTRSLSLLAALERIPNTEIFRAINQSRGAMRYVETLRSLIRVRRDHHPDLYILGFRGHEIAWLVRRLTRGRLLVFDALMSPYAALTEERKAGFLGVILGWLWRPWETHALHAADLVLTDTALHAAYYARAFDLPPERVLPLPVGALESDTVLNVTAHKPDAEQFSILFYGSFLPLHGIDVIVAAAALVKDLPLRFDFIGGNTAQAGRLHALCTRLGVTRYTHRAWVPFDELISRVIPGADLCLGGPFGKTPQARRVVTSKTSQCIALGRPTVIGAIEADYGFTDKHNCLLVAQGNAQDLAAALRWAWEHRDALPALGAAGQKLYVERLSVSAIATMLGPALQNLAATTTASAVRKDMQ